VDGQGSVSVTGTAMSWDLPEVGPQFFHDMADPWLAWIARFSPDGRQLELCSQYAVGFPEDLEADPRNSIVYATGRSYLLHQTAWLPTTYSPEVSVAGFQDDAMVFATYVAGRGEGQARAEMLLDRAVTPAHPARLML
jgi:hypothetical protein